MNSARLLVCALAVSGLLVAQEPGQRQNRDSSIATVPEQFRRVPPPDPKMSVAQLEAQGDSLRADKAYVDALDYYRAALLKGTSAVLHNKIGIAQLNLLRYDLAKKAFEKAIKVNPKYAEAHNNLGVVLYTKKKYGGAAKRYRKALQLAPRSASFYSNLGTAYFADNKFKKAIESYSMAVQIDPEIFDRRSLVGIAAHLSSPEDRGHYHFVLARMFASVGDVERGLIYLRRALEEGYPEVNKANEAPEFAELRKDPRFTLLMESDITRLSPPPSPK